MINDFDANFQHILAQNEYLPVVGWGYPDLAPCPASSSIFVNRYDLEAETINWLHVAGPQVWPLYQAVGMLQVECIISLTPDPILPKTLEYYDQNTVILGFRQAIYSTTGKLFIPLGGLSSDPESMILSDNDYLNLSRKHEILWEIAQGYATRVPLLVLGCDPNNRMVRHILNKLRQVPPHGKAGWLVCSSATEENITTWNTLGFEIIQGPIAKLLRDIVRFANRPASSTHYLSNPLTDNKMPYKHLNYFERNEGRIFFGRESEIKRLIDMVCAHRLVVLTGPSGVGKTSLINAGLLTWADQSTGHIGVYTRCNDSPVVTIRQSMSQLLNLDASYYGDKQDLTAFLAQCRDKVDSVPIIVLDQAEELFTRVNDNLRNELMIALRQCLTVSPIVTRFVLSLREDYLARLAELRDWIPNLLQNMFYLTELSEQGALDAIIKPAGQVGVTFEKALADKIISDLGPGLILPTQIQLICSRLFEERKDNLINNQLYHYLGGAQGILREYLNNELQFLAENKAEAQSVLKALVTSRGTKDLLRVDDVSKRTGINEIRARELLFYLRDQSRLLRGIVQQGEIQFELAHEYLTNEIWSWLSKEERDKREIEDLLSKELRSWHRFKHLRLGRDRLKIFESNSELLDTDEDSIVLLLLSAIKHQRPTAKWTYRVNQYSREAQDSVTSQLFDYIQGHDFIQRREAAETFTKLDPAALVRSLRSPETNRRATALEILGGIELRAVVGEVASLLNDPFDEIRVLACGALGEIRGAEAIKALIKAAQSGDLSVAPAAIAALGRSYTPRTYNIIKNALTSNEPLWVMAGQQAIGFSRDPRLVKSFLTDKSLNESAHNALWNTIKEHPNTLGEWIFESMEYLNEVEQEQAIRSLSGKVNMLRNKLTKLRGKGGILGKWAKEQLEELKKKNQSYRHANGVVSKKLKKNSSIQQIKSFLLDEELQIVFAAINCLAKSANYDTRINTSIIGLLKDNQPKIRAGSMTILYNTMSKPPDQLEWLLPHLLDDTDATVRYYACLVAEKYQQIEISELIGDLLEDYNTGNWYDTEVGLTVRDAAIHALDRLRPNSNVWRKPFQRSFGKNKVM